MLHNRTANGKPLDDHNDDGNGRMARLLMNFMLIKRYMKIHSKTITYIIFAWLVGTSAAYAAANDAVLALAKKEQPGMLQTMKELVEIESGSSDFEGLEIIAALIAKRLQELGGRVEMVEPTDIYKMFDTPEKIGRMVKATFTGTGAKKILLIAHMDTVYPRGMLSGQPFKVEGDRAYEIGRAHV